MRKGPAALRICSCAPRRSGEGVAADAAPGGDIDAVGSLDSLQRAFR